MLQRLLICTDLDRTLLPNGKQVESPSARKHFTRLVARPEITLAYVSGRHRELVAEAILEYQLPNPDWIIADVGTTLYQVFNDGQEWRHSHEWEQSIAIDWNGISAHFLRSMFFDLVDLRLQEETKQNRYKLSYYLPLQHDFNVLQSIMTERLQRENLNASLIYSVDEALETGLLDVLPKCATKLHAVEFLMRQQGFELHNTVFAGDSGNDLPVIASAIPSVLVANSSACVIAEAKALSIKQGTESAFYLAQGGFLGMNGNYSAGILEGVAHYLPQTQVWMEQNHEF
jgi:sucrose-6-phosphatase